MPSWFARKTNEELKFIRDSVAKLLGKICLEFLTPWAGYHDKNSIKSSGLHSHSTQSVEKEHNIVCSPHVSSQLRLIVGEIFCAWFSWMFLFHALHLEVLNSYTYNPWRVTSRGPFLFWNMVMCHFDGWHLGMRIWQASWMCEICRISLIRHGKKNLEPLGCQVRKILCLIHWCVT